MSSKDVSRPPIPHPMAREIRKRCGFGCVICGMPLYEYEHMAEWAIVQRHVAEEITLLCDQHHREKTNGLLPKEVVAAANADPFNLRSGASKPYDLHFSGKEAEIAIGTNTFKCTDQGYGTEMIPVIIDGIPVLAFILADGHLLLNVVIFNKYNEVVLHIQNNVLAYKTNAWDITLKGKTLTIREGQGEILLQIDFLPPNKISIPRGKLLCNGVEVEISGKEVVVNKSMRLSGNTAINCQGGLILGPQPNPIGGMIALPWIDRYQPSAK